MMIAVNDAIRLTEFRLLDRDALIKHLNESDIYEPTTASPLRTSPTMPTSGSP
jgi:hypothetical protein